MFHRFHLFRRPASCAVPHKVSIQSPCFNLHNVATSLVLLDPLRILFESNLPWKFPFLSPSYLHSYLRQGTAGSSARGAAGVFPGALTGVENGGQRGFQAGGASSCDVLNGDRRAEKNGGAKKEKPDFVVIYYVLIVRWMKNSIFMYSITYLWWSQFVFFVFFCHHDHLENDDQLYLSDEFTWMIM